MLEVYIINAYISGTYRKLVRRLGLQTVSFRSLTIFVNPNAVYLERSRKELVRLGTLAAEAARPRGNRPRLAT